MTAAERLLRQRTEKIASLLTSPRHAKCWRRHTRLGEPLHDGTIASDQLTVPGPLAVGEEAPIFDAVRWAQALNESIRHRGLNRFGRPPALGVQPFLVYFSKRRGICVRGVCGFDVTGAERLRFDIIGGTA